MVYDCFANIVQVPITDFNLPILQLLASTAKEHKNCFFWLGTQSFTFLQHCNCLPHCSFGRAITAQEAALTPEIPRYQNATVLETWLRQPQIGRDTFQGLYHLTDLPINDFGAHHEALQLRQG
jgi:hypothetical protein